MKVPLDPEKMNQDMSNPSLDRNEFFILASMFKIEGSKDGWISCWPSPFSFRLWQEILREVERHGWFTHTNGLEWHQLDLDVYLPCCMVNLPQNQTLISTSGAHTKFQCLKFGYLYPSTFSRWQQKKPKFFVYLQRFSERFGGKASRWEPWT